MEIWIAEDDKRLNDGILLALKNEETRFAQCFSCGEIRARLEGSVPDLVILDINFPDGSGLDILKEIRRRQLPVKVLMLTANNMESDIVAGLELGAEDYITKPFSLMVLRARVNVQLRSLWQTGGQKERGTVEIDDFCFDFERMVFTVGGRPVELSKTEQRLLRILVENRPMTVKRESLIDYVWNGDSDFVEEHALTVSVKRLRDKLGDDAAKPRYIKTVYGLGYAWAVK